MTRATFFYVIYIHGTPQDVWKGLVDPECTRRYWMHDNVSDWKAGSEWTHRRNDAEGTVDILGEVLECERPHKLVLTWCPPDEAGDPRKTSRVSFEIFDQSDWPYGPWAGLRLTHSDLESGSAMLESVTFGWPATMSGLKSVIESPRIFGSA